MTLAKDIKGYEPPATKRRCRWCEQWDRLSKRDRDAVAEAMFDMRISDRALTEIMQENGLYANQATIGRHRRGECLAGRT